MNAVKKEMSQQAQVAKIMRQYCKDLGIKCTARSDSYSMGNSVNVDVFDVSPEIAKKIEDYSNPYQYGHFDGMNDIYEHSNSRKDIPQTKYLFINKKFSPELHQAAWQMIREFYSDAAEAPEDYKDAGSVQVCGEWGFTALWRVLCGSDNLLSAKFWEDRQATTAPAITTITGTTIEEHTHTKRNIQMFIVIIAERVERETYLQYLETAKALGGWYSRKWGQTPAGFAFEDMADAETFAQSVIPGAEKEQTNV